MACPGSFLFCHGENDPDPKSGWYLDPDKLGCSIAGQGDVTDPKCFYIIFVSDSKNFATDPRVIGLVIGLVSSGNTPLAMTFCFISMA